MGREAPLGGASAPFPGCQFIGSGAESTPYYADFGNSVTLSGSAPYYADSACQDEVGVPLDMELIYATSEQDALNICASAQSVAYLFDPYNASVWYCPST